MRAARVTLTLVVWWLAARTAEADETRAAVELFVNEVSRGEVIILLRDATPWVPIEALRGAGLRIDRTNTNTGTDTEYISLESLADRVSFRFDEQELQLRLTARPDQFQPQVLPVRSGAPPDLIRARNSSAFLNYAAFVDTDAGSGRLATTIATDAGISIRGALVRIGGGRDTTGRLFRSPTHLTVDDEAHLVRWDIGDTVAPGGLMSPTRPVLGVSVSREFGIDPYFVRYTPLTLNGTAATPSIAEVYINGQLVHRERLAPGSFTLTGLPASIGAGQAEVILRDTFGREQHLTSTFYEPASLLRPGLQQFHYTLGLQRDDTELFRYHGPQATASHRIGLTSYLTIGATTTIAPHNLTLEPELATRLPLGELTTRIATTHLAKRTTTSWLESWSYRGHGLSTAIAWRQTTASASASTSLAASSVAMPTAAPSEAATPAGVPLSPQFAASNVATATAMTSDAAPKPSSEALTPGAAGTPLSPQFAASSVATATAVASYAALAVPRRQLDAQVGWAMGRGISVSVAATDGVDWSGQRVRRQTVAISAPASRRGEVMVTAGRARLVGRLEYEMSVVWTMQLTERATVTAGVGRRVDGSAATQVAYQRSLPVGPGIGGRVQISPDGRDVDGMVQVQGDLGRIEMRRDVYGARASYRVGAAGAIVMADGGGSVLPTRTVDDAFAVVKVGDVPGVRVYASNQLVGRTNGRGEAVVPNLVSYYGNRLSIVPEDVPITYAIAAQEYAIAPALRGGAFVRFDAAPVRPVTGRFVIAGRMAIAPIVPAFGEARIQGERDEAAVSPLGKQGEFFFDRLEPGRHHARVMLDGVEYECALTVPDRSTIDGRAIDLGEVTCIGPVTRAAAAGQAAQP